MQAYDPDTHLAYKKVRNILEKRKNYKHKVRSYREARAPIDEKINRMLKQMVRYHDELGHDWFVCCWDSIHSSLRLTLKIKLY